MIRALKIVGIVLLVLVGGLLVLGLIAHEPLPEGAPGPAADSLARRMEQRLDKAAWERTRYVQWTFPGSHDYLWDRVRRVVRVRWSNYEVLLDPDTKSGLAWKAGKPLEGAAADAALKTAYGYFANDSFWLVAPFKAFDAGTTRSIVKGPDGDDQLLVSYSSGGVTPGDSYLWIFDDTGKPVAWKLWVKILPVGGITFSWEDWQQTHQGVWLAGVHNHPLFRLELKNIATANHLEELGVTADPFARLD